MPDHVSIPEGEGIEAARAYAGWYLGDRNWADALVSAYLNPEEAREEVAASRARFDRPREEGASHGD